jgi:glycoside/pentoside/hexuronide:cation symporter, GPH family
MSYATSILGLLCGFVCVFGTMKRTKSMPKYKTRKKEKNAFFKVLYNFFLTLKQENYGTIIISYSVALISAAFLTSVGMHLFTYCFHFNSTQIPIVMTFLFIGAIVSQLFWIPLSKKIDKKPTLMWAYVTILVGIALTFFVFLFRETFGANVCFWLVSVCITFCGFGTGALYSLPMSMFADNITMDKLKTGENKSATYSGYMTFAYNISNSVALLVIGILLDLIKFDPKSPVQALKVQNWLGVIVFGGCALSIIIAMLVLKRYDLKRSDILKQQLLAKQRKD